MISGVPPDVHESILLELREARERFITLTEVMRTNFGEVSAQVSRSEQVVYAIQRLEWELNEHDSSALVRRFGMHPE